jgi:hypothetical protein
VPWDTTLTSAIVDLLGQLLLRIVVLARNRVTAAVLLLSLISAREIACV